MSASPTTRANVPDAQEARKVVGLLPPLVTPFKDGTIDRASLDRMLDDLAGNVAGVLVGGSVGEVASLTVEERIELVRAVADRRDAVGDIAFAIGDNSIENSRRLIDAAGEAGADLLVVALPNYFAKNLQGLVEYLGALAELASADLCLYDNPLANHTPLTVSEILLLTDAVPRLTHVKVTDTTLEKVAALSDAPGLTIHAGDDAVLWHQLTRGVEGAMVALPMIYPQRAADLWRHICAGDLEAAYAEYLHVTAFLHVALGAPDYVAVIKTVLHARGVIDTPELRLPLVPLPRQRSEEVLLSFGSGA